MSDPKTPRDYIHVIRANLKMLREDLEEMDCPHQAHTVKQLFDLCTEALERSEEKRT
jgi:hypothetical protein